jgi:hypothetical protein
MTAGFSLFGSSIVLIRDRKSMFVVAVSIHQALDRLVGRLSLTSRCCREVTVRSIALDELNSDRFDETSDKCARRSAVSLAVANWAAALAAQTVSGLVKPP